MVGFTIVGLCVGLMIGIVQLLTRDAWLRMIDGPLAGKEFLFYKDNMTLGASPKCEIYLFNDSRIIDRHAALRVSGDSFEIQSLDADAQVLVNDRTIRQARLRHGDRITIGSTSFIFQMKQG
jgi:predicted component of type VI protein secretion system